MFDCDMHFQDLLMLAHGEASLLQTAALKLHMLHCSKCRRQYEQNRQLSSALHSVLKGDEGTRWKPVRCTVQPARNWLWVALLAAAMLMIWYDFRSGAFGSALDALPSWLHPGHHCG